MIAGNRLAVITGGGTGIGATIAVQLAREGWDICLTYHRSGEEAAGVLAAIKDCGVVGAAFKCDVGVKAQVDSFYEAVLSTFGRAPDLLVNNAAVQTWAPLLELSEEDWDRVIQTNLKGCFLNTQRAAALMIADERGGRIVNIGSGSNKVPFPRLVDYTTSKGGVEMFTKVAAVELGSYGITVNCVAPGAIETARTLAEAPEYAETWASVTPLGRVGQPSDVADAVSFLASAQASFITGQTLTVDGGAFTKPNWPYSAAEQGRAKVAAGA